MPFVIRLLSADQGEYVLRQGISLSQECYCRLYHDLRRGELGHLAAEVSVADGALRGGQVLAGYPQRSGLGFQFVDLECPEIATQSGDIIDGRNGATEFIDITIDPAIEQGARYIAMNVLVYSGPTFAEHEECFAGWMTRSKPQSNEIFDPKTVEQKIDLRGNSKNCIPVLFDLEERKAIWADMTTRESYGYSNYGGNNVESNRATIEQTTEAVVDINNKVNLYELFLFHADARGSRVENREDADTVFAWDGDVTPYDITLINSEYIK